MNNKITECPQDSETPRTSLCYKLSLISLSLIGVTALSFTLIKVEHLDVYLPPAVQSMFARFGPDHAVALHDGDPITRISNAKTAITHNQPGMVPVVEVTDLQYGKAFYSTAVVQDGFARFELDAGNPQDAGRTFKVRGLLLPASTQVHFGMPYDTPLSGDELFPQMLLHRT